MARGRMVSKDISLDEGVDALSDDTARLLFTWMIPHLDCEGRIYGDAKIFISIVAPRRSYSVKRIEKYLTEMEKIGLIERYLINGNLYLVAPKFEKHQTGLRKERESPSHIPPKTPDLLRQDHGSSPTQVKYKIKSNNNSSKDVTGKDNIYKLFEQEIGLLTPMIAEQLKDAESTFPDNWIKDAIKEAARANVRRWSYIEAILKNWATNGRDVKTGGKYKNNEDPDKYVKGKYSHMVRRK